MLKWPTSVWNQVLISFAASVGGAALAFHWEQENLFAQYAREAPHDGQDGLAAFMGAIGIAIVTFFGVLLFTLILQRALAGSSSLGKD